MDLRKWELRKWAKTPYQLFVNPILSDTVYSVKLLATSQYGCSDSLTKNIRVFPKPIANYSLSDSIGCHPFAVDFTNQSSIADSCRWNFGDATGDSTCFNSQNHIYGNFNSSVPQNYTASLFVYSDNGCLDTLSKPIRVYPNVVAAFNSDTAGCSPLPVQFSNVSTGGQNFDWQFGDGGNSFAQNPSHIYINPGLSTQN